MLGIIFDEEEKSGAVAGDNVKLKLRGIEEEVRHIRADMMCVLCHSPKNYERD